MTRKKKARCNDDVRKKYIGADKRMAWREFRAVAAAASVHTLKKLRVLFRRQLRVF